MGPVVPASGLSSYACLMNMSVRLLVMYVHSKMKDYVHVGSVVRASGLEHHACLMQTFDECVFARLRVTL